MALELRTSGSIFDPIPGYPRPVLVCPVNCQPGVLGAGLAREFARRWPDLVDDHRFACLTGVMRPGMVRLVYPDGNRPFVLFFPTKDEWSRMSRPEWIRAGLADLRGLIERHHPVDPMTWVFPAIGCGLGGLRWDAVRPMIEATASGLPGHKWIVYR